MSDRGARTDLCETCKEEGHDVCSMDPSCSCCRQTIETADIGQHRAAAARRLGMGVRRLSYPERWQAAVEEGATLAVFVLDPEATTPRLIAPHSGIVGEVRGDRVLVHYEGFIHRPRTTGDERAVWLEKVKHAAGRAVTEYPTVARMLVSPDDLIQVGTFHVATGTVEVTDEFNLTVWLR